MFHNTPTSFNPDVWTLCSLALGDLSFSQNRFDFLDLLTCARGGVGEQR